MKQLVSDQELIHYLDGNLSDQEIKTLQARLEEQGEPDKLDKWIEDHFPADKAQKLIIGVAVVLGIALSVLLDMLFQPTYAVAAKISSTFLEETDRNDKH